MHGVVLKGIEPMREHLVSKSSEYVVPAQSFNHLDEGEIILGEALAQQLELTVGDKVNVLLPEPGTQSLASIKPYQLNISRHN